MAFGDVIPRPSAVRPGRGEFVMREGTAIALERAPATVAADRLRDLVRAATGLALPVAPPASLGPDAPTIAFTGDGADGLGDEGYELRIAPDRVEVAAAGAAGFGWAVQTLRQALPAGVGPLAFPGAWALPACVVRDAPRFPWRGVMLDVARHFFAPADVERVIDLLAAYKMNRLHLHLSDDQGWRLEIERHPALTEVGAGTAVGGGPGGYYTRADYRRLVTYAAERNVVVVPEIDMPGHTNAALAAIPALNCDDVAPVPYTGVEVGFSSLCVDREQTYEFVDDVIAELAELTPGPYVHIGGDESHATDPEAYRRFVERAVGIVRAHGKRPVGWDEIATASTGAGAVVQHWISPDHALAAAAQGAQVVMSPAPRAYLDMKYDESTPIGVTWAGHVDTRTAYEWDPATHVRGLPGDAVLGVEAPLWTETVTTLAEIERMLLPRLPGYAELGWSPATGRSWDEYRGRLARHARRWRAEGRTFTEDPAVPWER